MCNFKLGNFVDAIKGGLDPLEIAHKSQDGSVKNNLFDPLRMRDANKPKETTTTLPYVGPKSYTPATATAVPQANLGTVTQNGAIVPLDAAAAKKKLELF